MIRLAVIAATLVVSTAAYAQPSLPSTPAGQAAASYIEALNSRDPAKGSAFVKERFPTSPIDGAGIAAFARQTGGFDVVRLEEQSSTSLTALVRERYSEMYARLRVETDNSPPYQIRSLGARVTPRPAGLPAPEPLGPSELRAAVESKMRLMGEDFSGTVLLARHGRPFATISQGWADRARRIKNTSATRYRVGSMDKMFTAIAVLQLAQAGRVDLHAPLITYLKDYPNAGWASTVTLHQLLTHTGGAGDIFGPEYNEHRDQLRTLADYVRLYGAREPTFAPGSKWSYSNYGFVLLGRVVEAVTGQTYYDCVRARIFDPAGMTGSGFEPETTSVPNRAIAYERTAEGFAPAGGLPWRGTSAGGGYSTAEDFLKFAAAFQDGRLLDQRHQTLMTSAHAEDGAGGKVGYGVMIYPGPTPMVGHSGGAPGMSGDLRMSADGAVVILALSNVSPPFLAGRLTQYAAERLQPG